MSVSFIGTLQTSVSEDRWYGLAMDPDHIQRVAREYDQTDFDHVLIGWSSMGADGLMAAAHAAAATERIGFLVAHRTGFIAPTVAEDAD